MNFEKLLKINNIIIDNLQDCCKFIYRNNVEIIKKENTIVNHIDFIEGKLITTNIINIVMKNFQLDDNIYCSFGVYKIYPTDPESNRCFFYEKYLCNKVNTIVLPHQKVIDILNKIFRGDLI